jgi:peptide/nickel transport system ATP-binding protein
MSDATTAPVLAIRELTLELATDRGMAQALRAVSLEVAPGEIVGLVGESGSGKSVTAMTVIRLLSPRLSRFTGGSILLLGQDLRVVPASAMREMRGKLVSMVFQEPMSALNPTMRIGRQITQVLRRHERMDAAAAARRALQLLTEMHVADPARVVRSYPFELSGGMRQRVLIAMAFACNPRLLIADEPTTALDVTVQAQVLSLIRERAYARGTAVLFISHDLAVVSQLCTRVYVMYAGEIVESGETDDVLRHPCHPYTRALLRSLPETAIPGQPLHSISGTMPSPFGLPSGCRFRERCEWGDARCAEPPPFALVNAPRAHVAACWYAQAAADGGMSTLEDAAPPPPAHPPAMVVTATDANLVELAGVELSFAVGRNWLGRPAMSVHALNGIDLEIRRRETLAIVGESGCGKSTLAQLVMGLLRPSAGRVRFDGMDFGAIDAKALRQVRQRLQMVFQDSQSSLDPRMPAWRLIAEPLQVVRQLGSAALRRRAVELAQLVGIREEQLERYSHEFSGGQRQRLAIARALALEPELLVLDEPTSALDVSIQAQILNLLMELQTRLGLTYLFISHNVSLVRHVADRVAVMYLGQIVEIGTAALVLEQPQHPYTRQLIAAVPKLHRQPMPPDTSAGEQRGNLNLPTGCYFRSRCADAGTGCGETQTMRLLADGRSVRCHRA